MQKGAEFKQLFLPISITLFATVVAVSSFFTFFANRTLVRTVYESEARNLENAGEATELLIRRAATIAYQVHNDVQIKQLLFFDELDVFEQSLSMAQLKSFWQVVPQLHSIYLYNEPQDTFFLATGARVQLVQPREEFFDREAVEFLRDEQVVNSGRPVARLVPVDREPVYTFVFDFIRSTAAEPSSTIFVNFHASWLIDRVNRFAFTDDQTTLAINDAGEIVLNTSRGLPRESLLGEVTAALEEVAVRAGGDRGRGYVIGDIDGERVLVSAFFRPDLQWTFVRVTPLGSLLRKVEGTRRVLLGISIGFLVVSLVIAFLLSRRIYVPFSDALERFENLEQQAEASQEVVNRQLLYSFLLQPGAGRESSLYQSLLSLDLSIEIERPSVTALFSPLREVTGSEEDRHGQPVLERELTLVRRVLGRRLPCEVVLFRGANLLAIANVPDDERFLRDGYPALIREVVDELAKELAVSAFAAYEHRPKAVVEAANDLDTLEEAIEYHLIFGWGAAVSAEVVAARNEQHLEVTSDQIDHLVNAIRSREFSSAKTHCRQMLNYVAHGTPTAVRNSAIRLIASINQTIRTIEENTGSRFVISFSALLRDAERCSTLPELHRFFDSLIDTIERGMATKQSRRNSEIVLAIKRVTRAQYQNRNLSSVRSFSRRRSSRCRQSRSRPASRATRTFTRSFAN